MFEFEPTIFKFVNICHCYYRSRILARGCLHQIWTHLKIFIFCSSGHSTHQDHRNNHWYSSPKFKHSNLSLLKAAPSCASSRRRRRPRGCGLGPLFRPSAPRGVVFCALSCSSWSARIVLLRSATSATTSTAAYSGCCWCCYGCGKGQRPSASFFPGSQVFFFLLLVVIMAIAAF